MKLICQFLYLICGFLFFRRLEKVFKEERNKDKEGNRYNEPVTVERNRDDEILGFDLGFVG